MSDLEQQLRQLFAEDAMRAPRPRGLAEGAVRRVRHHRRAQVTWSVTASAAALAVGALFLGGLPGEQRQRHSVTHPTPTQGAAGTGSSASCVGSYTVRPGTSESFAVDGTVTAVRRYRPTGWAHPSSLVVVTMTVHEWFTGGSATTARITGPEAGTHKEWLVPGARLLIASRRPPGSDGIGDDCGRTLRYTPATADAWRAAWSAPSRP